MATGDTVISFKGSAMDMDIAELEEYIEGLEAEIERARAMIQSKKSIRAGADALFKKK